MLRGRLRIACVLVLALGVSGCESLEKLNPFGDGKKPIVGQRTPVFPEGVPGVEAKAPVLQPSNSNVPLGAAPTLKPE